MVDDSVRTPIQIGLNPMSKSQDGARAAAKQRYAGSASRSIGFDDEYFDSNDDITLPVIFKKDEGRNIDDSIRVSKVSLAIQNEEIQD